MEAFSASRIIRVVLTGSESTGKSTLASELAQHYDAVLVPEFVRSLAEEKGGPIEFSDHGAIAHGQMMLEDAAIERASRLVVQDTDLLSTVVYCRHYFGRCPAWIEEAAMTRRPDLYLLAAPDIPWLADGVRDRGHMREEIQRLFMEAVGASGARCVSVYGDRIRRFVDATRAIDDLIHCGPQE
jgi:NadR type nicotinamide-nucleotide adenylyltransferase